MTRRSGRPQHLSLDHPGAVMAWHSSAVSPIPCLDQALSRFQQVDQRGGTLDGPPPGPGAPSASRYKRRRCWRVPPARSPRTVYAVGEDGAEALIATKSMSDLARRRRSEQGSHPEGLGLGSRAFEDMPAARDPVGQQNAHTYSMYRAVAGRHSPATHGALTQRANHSSSPARSAPYTDAYDSRYTCFFCPLGSACKSLCTVVH